MVLSPQQPTRLPATGPRPVAGSLTPSVNVGAVLAAQLVEEQLLQVQHDTRRFGSGKQSTLPETPLRSVHPLGVENLVTGIGGVGVLMARQRALAILTLARKGAVYSGHPGFDAAFWAAYLRFKGVQNLLTDVSGVLLTIPVPDREPVEASGLLQQLLLSHPSQDQLRQFWLNAQVDSPDQVRAQIARLKYNRDVGYKRDDKFIDPIAADQIIRALEGGLEVADLQEINRFILGTAAAQLTADLSKQFWGLLGTAPAVHRGDKADP